jgi:hypothetical protein
LTWPEAPGLERVFWNKKKRKIRGFVSLSLSPGANPTTPSYNASVVKLYNATSSQVRFEIKNIFFFFEKTL